MTTTTDTSPGPTPQRARDFLNLAIDNGWAAAYVPNIDTGGAPYVTITARRGHTEEIRAAWHTRNTGTYRLDSCMAKGGRRHWYDVSLTAARSIIETAPAVDGAL